MANVLVVDDSLTDRRLAGGLLGRNADWQIHYAANGRDALEQIELHLPDLVVTDLNMPEVDGLELVRLIHEQYPLVPVILMTAQGSEQIAVQALQSGASSYVPKQRLSGDLLNTVAQVLTISQADRARARLMRRLRQQQVQFELENDTELISTMVQYLQDAALGMQACNDGDRVRVGVALQEALINACFHGNLEVSSELRQVDHHAYYDLARQRTTEAPYASRRIYVSAEFNTDVATFVIRDEGPGFDPTLLPDPTDPSNLEKPSGRGLLLMQTFMDQVVYNDTGNQVTLIKRSKSATAPVVGDSHETAAEPNQSGGLP